MIAAVSGLVLLAACAAPMPSGRPATSPAQHPTASSAPRVAESPSAERTPTPIPTPTPPPGYRPWLSANYGSHATVIIDKLNVRTFAGLEREMLSARLTAGTNVFITDGPIPVDGLWWYEIEFDGRPFPGYDRPNGFGWVAGQSGEATQNPGDDEWLIQIGPVNCPDSIDMPLLARLSPWAVGHCAHDVHEIGGVLDECGPSHVFLSYVYEPSWAAYPNCFLLRDERGSWYFSFAFAPDAALPDVERGDIVSLSGGVGIDTAKYGPCNVTGGGEISLETMTAKWRHDCQNRFVVTGATIEGHVELPPQPW
jgi:hypothetical protein